jgi:hypothetical protein
MSFSPISSSVNEFKENSETESKIPKQFRIKQKPKTFKIKKTKEQIQEELQNVDIADDDTLDAFCDNISKYF